MKKCIKLLILMTLIIISTTEINGQDVEIKLQTSDSTSSFLIYDGMGSPIFSILGNGYTNYLGSPKVSGAGNVSLQAISHPYPQSGGNLFLSGGHKIHSPPYFSYPASISISGASSSENYSEIGGSISIVGGDADQKGGDVSIKAGQGAYAGNIELISGYGRTGSPAGNILLQTGTSPNSNGGQINLVSEGGISLNPNWGSHPFPNLIVTILGSGTYTGDWTQYSDSKFVKNILPIGESKNRIMKLNPISFLWNSEEFPDKNFSQEKAIGLLAHEVEELFPEIVKEDKEGFKSVDYTKLSVILLSAFQEQQKEINTLKDLVTKLSEKLN